MTGGRGTWPIMLADLSLILFVATAVQASHSAAKAERAGDAPAGAGVAQAFYSAGPGAPPLSNWITEQFGVELDARSNVARDQNWSTNVPGVFVAGDMGRGQSLIVWAIAEGRSCAASVDHHLMGETGLPSPVRPTDRPLV